jgi:drug/metabolite transporter (DMT)-like permease
VARLLGPLFVVLWSSGFLAAGIGTRDVPGLSLTTWRLLLAGVLFAGVALLTRAPWPRGRREWAHLLRTGVLLHAVQFGCGYTAIGLGVPAGLAALVLCLSPVLVALLAGPVLGERLGLRGAVGSAIAVFGTVIAGLDHLDDGGTPLGLVLLGLGLAGFAAGTLCQKRSGASMDLRTGSAVQVLVAFVALAPVTLVVDGGLLLPHTAAGAGALLWLAVVNSGAAALLLFVLLRRGSAASVSGLLYVVPAVTAVLAVPVLGQSLSVQTLVGLGVTLVGVVLVQRATRPGALRAPRPPADASPAARG